MIFINPGKIFEEDFKNSVPGTCWVYRLRDNASSFANGKNTRFTSSNICDFLLYDDITSQLFLIECKSTKEKSLPLSMIRESQIEGLKYASEHSIIPGLLVNFRNENNDTLFIKIQDFIEMINGTEKKSFNINDLKRYNAIIIESFKKRTRYKYRIDKLVNSFGEK